MKILRFGMLLGTIFLNGCFSFTQLVPSQEIQVTRSPTQILLASSAAPQGSTASLPTLDDAEINELVMELLITNADCDIPCFWDIVPGETTWESATKILDPVAQRVSNTSATQGFARINLPPEASGEVSLLSPDFYLSTSKIVELIHISNVAPIQYPDFSIDGLFSLYGIPTRMLVNVNTTTPQGPAISYFVEYRNLGLLVYSWGFGTGSDLGVEYCFSDISWSPEIWMWAPEMTYSFEKLLPPAEFAEDYYDIEDVSNTSIQTIVASIVDGSDCLILNEIIE